MLTHPDSGPSPGMAQNLEIECKNKRVHAHTDTHAHTSKINQDHLDRAKYDNTYNPTFMVLNKLKAGPTQKPKVLGVAPKVAGTPSRPKKYGGDAREMQIP